MRDTSSLELAGEPKVPIAIKLQPERGPGWHAQVAQPQALVDKVKIVVKALPSVESQERLAGRLVVPRFVTRARLHRRENRNQSWLRAALLHQRGDLIRFAQAAGANEFDPDSMLGGHPLGVITQRLAQRLRKLRVVKDADVTLVQVVGHHLGTAK